MADNVKLLMKLRESERNRKQKLRDAKTEQAKKAADDKDIKPKEEVESEDVLEMPSQKDEKAFGSSEGGFFGPGLLNPFGSSQDGDLKDDFLMADFEKLLRRRPQDIHKWSSMPSD